MPGLVTFVGTTLEEARGQQAAVDAFLPVEASLAQLACFGRRGTSGWELDGPVPAPAPDFTGEQGRYPTIPRIIEAKAPTGST